MKLKRQEILILLLIWGIGGAVVVLMAALYLRTVSHPAGDVSLAPPTPAPTYTVTYVDVTARQLYSFAKGEAVAWQADARLVSASTRWKSTAINIVGQPTEWTYNFYSRTRKSLYIVRVTPDGALATSEHKGPMDDMPYSVPEDKWQVDSPQALAGWLNYGGGTMLNQLPGIEVVMQMNMLTERLGPYWTVVGYSQETGDYLTIIMDTTNGEVIEKKSLQ